MRGAYLEVMGDLLGSAADELAALGRVDPLDDGRAVDLARRCLAELGCVGLFLHPAEEAFPISRAGPILEVAREHAAPVVVATGYFALSEPLQVAELAGNFPDVAIVMTTGGQINISGLSMVDAWLALKEHPNLHVTTNLIGPRGMGVSRRRWGDVPVGRRFCGHAQSLVSHQTFRRQNHTSVTSCGHPGSRRPPEGVVMRRSPASYGFRGLRP